MYAIIEDGGRQYRVEQGQVLDIDLRDETEVKPGDKIQFDRVLAFSDDEGLKLGKPHVEGVVVSAEVVGMRKGKKLFIQKLRRRKNSRRRTGFRPRYTSVRIESIGSA